MVPALIGTLTMLQTLLLTAVGCPRAQGSTPGNCGDAVPAGRIMAGRRFLRARRITQATLILMVAQLWFRIPFAGSFVILYTTLTLFVLAAVGIGLLLSSVVATMQQGMLFSFVILMPFTLLSGLTTPIENMPKALQYFTLLNPLRYAIDIIHRIYLEGVTLDTLFPELWPLAIISVVTLTSG
jgi:ABC-2 type transport system permease protein